MTERERQILQGKNVTAVNADELAIKNAMNEVAAADELPSAATLADGKIAKTSNRAWVAGDETDYSPFATAGTQVTEDSAITLTLDKKAAALYAAIAAGRLVKITIAASNYEQVVAMAASKEGTGNSVQYGFGFVGDGGLQFTAEELAGTADVVLTATIGET